MGDFRSQKLQFFAESRAAWRRWLARNHRRRDEVFLVFARKGTGKPCVSYDEAVREALCFGWVDGIKNRIDDERYCYRFTPRRPGSAWSPSNRRRVDELTEAGLMTSAGLARVEEAKQGGAWDQADRARAPRRMPPELALVLRRSARARRAFEALAPGQQRQFMLWVADAKKAETRARRAQRARDKLLTGARYP